MAPTYEERVKAEVAKVFEKARKAFDKQIAKVIDEQHGKIREQANKAVANAFTEELKEWLVRMGAAMAEIEVPTEKELADRIERICEERVEKRLADAVAKAVEGAGDAAKAVVTRGAVMDALKARMKDSEFILEIVQAINALQVLKGGKKEKL